MARTADNPTFAEVLASLAAKAVRDDIPADVAADAQSATAKALRLRPAAPATTSVRRRAEAYFSAVVRRRIVHGRAGSRATARLIASAIVEDLKEAGRDGSAIWHELERGWSERIPDDVLEEYRLRLCG